MRWIDPAGAMIVIAFVGLLWCLALGSLISLVVFGVVG